MRRSPLIATAGALVLAVSATLPAIASAAAPAAAATLRPAGLGSTTTPIKHVVVIIGENHTFDNVFATYQPPYLHRPGTAMAVWGVLEPAPCSL